MSVFWALIWKSSISVKVWLFDSHKIPGRTQYWAPLRPERKTHVSSSKGPHANKYWISEIFFLGCLNSPQVLRVSGYLALLPLFGFYAVFWGADLASLQVLLPISLGIQATTPCPFSSAQWIVTAEPHDCEMPRCHPLQLLLEAPATLERVAQPFNGHCIFSILESRTPFWRHLSEFQGELLWDFVRISMFHSRMYDINTLKM